MTDEQNTTGDYKLVSLPYRCNESLCKDDICMKSGGIFLVRNSNCEDKWWQGYLVDPLTGNPGNKMSYIPSSVRYFTDCILPSILRHSVHLSVHPFKQQSVAGVSTHGYISPSLSYCRASGKVYSAFFYYINSKMKTQYTILIDMSKVWTDLFTSHVKYLFLIMNN